MAYTTIDKPSDYFNTVLWTGNGSQRTITVGFQPDFSWLKNRGTVDWHKLSDSVRGANKVVASNANNAEGTETQKLQSFVSTGFTIGTDGEVNGNGSSQVAWNWKAGTSFTNDASSTGIGTIDSTGSVSTTAGFSIMTYTGTGSNGTVAHGLSAVPNMYIVKKRNATSQWYTYHSANTSAPETEYLDLESTAATSDSDVNWNDTAPTSTTFSLGTNSNVNNNGNTYVAYVFAEKQGYSKFGSYVGNGNVNGSFIYTGQKSAFVMIKCTSSAQDWIIRDNKRDTDNPTQKRLSPNITDAETSHTADFDFLSNGFKARGTGLNFNGSGHTYIYMAFAENPFVTSTGVPATAR